MNSLFANEWASFPELYAGHLTLALSALALGLLISAPLGIAASRSTSLAGVALGFASVVQTIPGLALLALMVPLMGGRIGFWPAFAALTLYSILPILRNTIVGLRAVDADVREAALAVGMTERQRLFQVDLPLAAPVIVAGLRTASVWVIGAATLATPVGAQSLGGYIFQGLQTRNWQSVIFGCLASAALALAIDQVIALVEQGARRRKRSFFIAAAIGFALVVAPALSVFANAQGNASGTRQGPLSGQTILIGAKTFTEQYILADLLRRELENAGARVEVRQDLGSTVAFDALAASQIDLYVDYSGTVWATNMHRQDLAPRDALYRETAAWLNSTHNILAYDRLGFQNAYAFAATQQTRQRLHLNSIADLANRRLTLGSDPEFLGRAEWRRVRDGYSLGQLRTRTMDSTFLYDAARNGGVDVITAYTTDGRIDAYGLTLLADPQAILPPYDAFVLVSPRARRNQALLEAMAPVRDAISDDAMRHANAMVDLDHHSVAEASAWLASALHTGRAATP